MKKIISACLITAMFYLTTCKTENTPAVSSGSWTFNSVTINDTKGTPAMWHNAVVAFIATNTTAAFPYLIVSDNTTTAFVSGNYPVGSGSGSISVQVTDSTGTEYVALPGSSGTITVNAHPGTVSLSSTGISMVKFGIAPYNDTLLLSFNITQTY
jgi:hypothetical protein